jgi:hypothetical protein
MEKASTEVLAGKASPKRGVFVSPVGQTDYYG